VEIIDSAFLNKVILMINTRIEVILDKEDREILRETLVEEGVKEDYIDDPALTDENFEALLDWYIELGEIVLEIAIKEQRDLTVEEFKSRVYEYSIYEGHQDDPDDLWIADIIRVCEAHRLLWGNFEGDGLNYGTYRVCNKASVKYLEIRAY
jgi:hypothetical protein